MAALAEWKTASTEEGQRHRKRLHALEGERSAVALISQTVRDLPDKMHGVATDAARQALEEWDDDHIRLVSVRIQVASLIVGAVGIAVAVLSALHWL